MATYRLASGDLLSDEEIERECAEYEREAWGGHFERFHTPSDGESEEPLTVCVELPASVVAQVDRKTKDRVGYIVKAAVATL